jgi:AcrR family transcriptional regulator
VATQEQRSTETRLAISAATIQCLIEDGYSATTTLAVHERAGVSRGALTHHFSSKQEMLISAIQHLAEVREKELSEIARDFSDDADRVSGVIELFWEMHKSDLFYAALELWTAARTDASLRDALHVAERELGRRHRRLAAEMFGEPFTHHPQFDEVFEMMLRVFRGAAVTRILRSDPAAEDALISSWAQLFVRTLTSA